MKTTKRTLKFFSVADWEEEEIYLRKASTGLEIGKRRYCLYVRAL